MPTNSLQDLVQSAQDLIRTVLSESDVVKSQWVFLIADLTSFPVINKCTDEIPYDELINY